MAKTKRKATHHKPAVKAVRSKSMLHKEVHPAISWAVLAGFAVIALLLFMSAHAMNY